MPTVSVSALAVVNFLCKGIYYATAHFIRRGVDVLRDGQNCQQVTRMNGLRGNDTADVYISRLAVSLWKRFGIVRVFL
jgi:hypothetical protein